MLPVVCGSSTFLPLTDLGVWKGSLRGSAVRNKKRPSKLKDEYKFDALGDMRDDGSEFQVDELRENISHSEMIANRKAMLEAMKM